MHHFKPKLQNMKKVLIGVLLIICVSSCKEKPKTIKEELITESYKPDADFDRIESDIKQWWEYHYKSINLSQNFVPLNEFSETISKQEFLKSLTSGKYIALKIETKKDSIERYQLFKLSEKADQAISSTIKDNALYAYKYFEMESKIFPEFEFTDLNGEVFNNESLKGKTTLIKTWFIQCTACIAEFPELNELVEKFNDREDVLFISLALDSKSDLEKFLIKKKFNYKVVPDQYELITEKLGLKAYPTHLLINENGVILKVTNKFSDMIDYIEANDVLDK